MKYLKSKVALVWLVILCGPLLFVIMLKAADAIAPVALLIGLPCAVGWMVYQRRRTW